MTETNPPITPRTEAGSDQAGQSDPLLHLYKMSTTAGLGSTEYVEVNVVAVVAVLFGLASLLAMLSNVLLIIPVVGVVLSVVALRQIRGSNGTQTGRGLAWLGLVLSGLITAGIACFYVTESLHRRADEEAIAALCQKYGQLLNDRKYDQAYDLFDDDFKSRVPRQAFVSHLTSIQQAAGDFRPPIEWIAWAGIARFQGDDEGGLRAAATMKVHFRGWLGEPRQEVHFRRLSGGPWLIDEIPEQFPTPKGPKPPQ